MRVRALIPLVLAASSACAAAQTAPVREPPGVPVCPGRITYPAAFSPVQDAPLRALALGRVGQGGLCDAQTLEVREPVTVYRVWNRARPFTQFGTWWSLERPQEAMARLRERLVVCPEWSALDALVQCRLRAGTHVAYGPGQSAVCASGVSYPASDDLQLYVPNDTRATPNALFVEDCQSLPWSPQP